MSIARKNLIEVMQSHLKENREMFKEHIGDNNEAIDAMKSYNELLEEHNSYLQGKYKRLEETAREALDILQALTKSHKDLENEGTIKNLLEAINRGENEN